MRMTKASHRTGLHMRLPEFAIRLMLIALAFVWLLPYPASAHDRADEAEVPTMVRATDPQGLMAVLRGAGYDSVKFHPRAEGRAAASIEIVVEGLTFLVLFSDCEEAIPDFCETLVLSTSWDRKTPISDAAITKANQQYRYVSVWRDEDGDPFMQWAILTRRDGISAPLFLNAIERYLGVVRQFWRVAFDGDVQKVAEKVASESDQ